MKNFKSFITEAKVEFIDGTAVFINPSSRDVLREFETTNVLRGVLTTQDDQLYVWNGYEQIHSQILEGLGYDFEPGMIFIKLLKDGDAYVPKFEVMSDINMGGERIKQREAAQRSRKIARMVKDLPDSKR